MFWDCCQIPDFSKRNYGNHVEVVKKVFDFLKEINKESNTTIDKNRLKETDVVVVILPDHGSRYLAKIFNDDWMKKQNFI